MDLGKDAKYDKMFHKAIEGGDMVAKLLVTKAIQNAQEREGRENGKVTGIVDAMGVGLGVVTGAAMITAQVIAAVEIEERVPQDLMLFVGMLAALCYEPGPVVDGKIEIAFDYNLGKVVEALNMFERATGRKVDHMLVNGMVRAARDTEAESAAPLDAFMAGRKAN